MITLIADGKPISFDKMLNPYKFYVSIFNTNSESLEDIKDAFRLIKPYLDPDNSWDYGLFEDAAQELKIILSIRYRIEEYPEYWI